LLLKQGKNAKEIENSYLLLISLFKKLFIKAKHFLPPRIKGKIRRLYNKIKGK
jgi:hypothetical protein